MDVVAKDVAPFLIWLNMVKDLDYEPQELVPAFRQQFRGEWDSKAAYAEHEFYDSCEVGEAALAKTVRSGLWPFGCIDWKAASIPLFEMGALTAIPSLRGGVYVFHDPE